MKSILCILALSLLPTFAKAALPSVFIEDLTWTEVRDAISGGATTAIYYAGSTEQNGPHLATGKHNFVARHVAGRIASELGTALVYPILPFAPTGDAAARSGHMRFPGSVSVSEETYTAVARDVAASARAAGFRFVMLMGDHGGGQQALEKLAAALDRQWGAQGTRVAYVPEVYFGAERRVNDFLAARGIKPGAHASVPDTSEMMAIDPAGRWLRADKFEAGDAKNGVDGDPRQATAEFGRLFIDFKVHGAVERIRRFVASGR
jgi:creatinine amidohydrolase/Fe(II)-dependent formamide hydrolase-like protein